MVSLRVGHNYPGQIKKEIQVFKRNVDIVIEMNKLKDKDSIKAILKGGDAYEENSEIPRLADFQMRM